MPYELPKHVVITLPGRSIRTKSGVQLIVRFPTPRGGMDRRVPHLTINVYVEPRDYPFGQIATTGRKGLFPGFKLYTPLGHQPLDSGLPYLHGTSLDGDCFYARCEREGIPIPAHCSPGGMTTHELRYFMEHDAGKPLYNTQSPDTVSMSTAPADAAAVASDKEEMTIRYFYEHYAHPTAWRKVLRRFPKLKLCLAHFGDDEFKGIPDLQEPLSTKDSAPHRSLH